MTLPGLRAVKNSYPNPRVWVRSDHGKTNMAMLASTAPLAISAIVDTPEVHQIAGSDPGARLLIAQAIFDQMLIMLASPNHMQLHFPPLIAKTLHNVAQQLRVTSLPEVPSFPPSQESIDKTIAQLQHEGRVIMPSLWQI